MINNLVGKEVFLKLFARRYNHFFCTMFVLSALLLTSTQPAIAQFSVINVKSAPYNAKGDGVTDDSAAIQAAVNAAAVRAGSTVFFPIGTYFHSSAINVVGNRTTLRGQNRNTTLTGAGCNYSGTGINISQLRTSVTNPSSFNTANQVGISNCQFDAPVEFNSSNDCQISNAAFNETLGTTALRFAGCNRVENTACNFSGQNASSVLLTCESTNDVTVRLAKFNLVAGMRSIFFNVGARGLVETCTFKTPDFSFAVTADDFAGLTFRSNSLEGTGALLPTVGFYAIRSNNLLVQGNKFRNLNQPAFFTDNSDVQAVSNNISDCAVGPNLQGNTNVFVSKNGIFRSQSHGIYCDNFPGTQIIQENTMSNCGLSGIDSVIFVGSSKGGNKAIIQKNLCTGNQNGLTYFIRCELPAPPAVVSGNLTTTMLPTAVGP